MLGIIHSLDAVIGQLFAETRVLGLLENGMIEELRDIWAINWLSARGKETFLLIRFFENFQVCSSDSNFPNTNLKVMLFLSNPKYQLEIFGLLDFR